MSKRGRISIEDRIGQERFKSLLSTYPDVADIAELVCDHEITKEKKRGCEACRRAIYRAKERIDALNRQEKTFAPINEFAEIPEIKSFIEYQKSKGARSSTHCASLFRMWTWIKDSHRPELIQTQRPIVWDDRHIQYIRVKLEEKRISKYGHIQALRQFFNSCKRFDMVKNTALAARARDMRSPNGTSREINRFTAKEYTEEIRPMLNEQERFAVDLHVTLKCREGEKGKGSLLNLKWTDIDEQDGFYGFPTMTARVFEPKTSGGTTWEHCPVAFWFSDLPERLKKMREQSTSEYILPYVYEEYRALWAKISATINKNFQPHDCRRSPSGWLRDLGLSDLAIGQYDARSGKATGFAGVGWENADIFFARYGKMNPTAIYDKKQRPDVSMFDGLVNKILEAKA